jgi:adenine phosphoribosyltransferase
MENHEKIKNMFENVIKHYPDIPKPGIDFIDVLPSLQDKEAFRQAISEIDRFSTAPNVATVEARGFLFAAPLLSVSDHVKNIVPFRKKGKLPFEQGDLVRVEIMKEYGSDELFYRRSDFVACEANGDYIDVTIFDDLLATGGTVKGIADSLQQQTFDGKKIRIKEFVFLVELPALKGRAILEDIAPVHSLLSLAGVE